MGSRMEEGLLLVDRYRELAYVDTSACRLLGCRDEINLRQRWGRIKAALDFPELTSRISRGDNPLHDAFDQAFTLEVGVAPVDSPAFRGYVIRVRRPAVDEATTLQLLMESQAHNQSYLNAALVHDLRAPLNAMEIHLQLLAENVGGSDWRFAPLPVAGLRRQALQGVQILQDELAHLNRTLGLLLGGGQPLATACVDVDLVLALQELVVLLLPQARQQRVELQLRCNPSRLLIHGNKDYLKQAFLNIAINAFEAMPDGGVLLIVLSQSPGQAEIAFVDQGPGIAKELLGQIGQRRFSTKPDGSGMGLYAARRVMTVAHHGSFEVTNLTHGGVCVTCRLPLRPRPPD